MNKIEEKINKGGKLNIAHRGNCALERENTMKAFRRALQDEVDIIETDVRVTSDDVLVLVHNGREKNFGFIAKRTYRDLKKKFPEVVTVREFLEEFGDKVVTNFELKPKQKNIIENFMNEIRHYKHNVVVSSFDYKLLGQLRQYDSEIRLGVLVDRPFRKYFYIAKKIDAYAIFFYYRLFLLGKFRKCKSLGYRIFVWCIPKKKLKTYAKSRYDGIITDYTHILKELIK